MPRKGLDYEQGRHVRISRELGELLDKLAAANKWTFKVVVETALEQLAKDQGVKWPEKVSG